MQLKAGFTVLPNLKKFTEGNWRNRTRKLPINLQNPHFARSKTACVKTTDSIMLYKHHGSTEIEL